MPNRLKAVAAITLFLFVIPTINSGFSRLPFSTTQGQMVNITSPIKGEFLRERVNISIEYDGGKFWEENTSQWVKIPVTEMKLEIDNVTVKNWSQELGFSGTVNYTWDTEKYDDGPHLLYVWQENAIGDEASTQIVVNADNTPPEAQIIYPEPYSWVKGEVNFTLYLKELGSMDRIEIYVDGKLQNTLKINKPWDDPYDVPWIWHSCEFSDGGHIVTFILHDMAGNSFSLKSTYFVDNTAPQLRIISPSPGHWVREGKDILLDINDSGSGLYQLKIYVNDSLDCVITATQWSNPYEVHWHWANYPDGEVNLLIIAYDNVGNTASTRASYNVDNTPPVLEVEDEKITLKTTLDYTLNYSAQDNFGIAYYAINIIQQTSQGTGLWKRINTTHTNLTFQFEDNATYWITIRAFDYAGNYAEKIITVKVDYNYPPKLVKSNIPEVVKAGKEITFYAQGADVKGDKLNYTWFVDGKKVGEGKYLNISLTAGEHTLKLVINDGYYSVDYTWIIVAHGEKTENEPISPYLQVLLNWIIFVFLFIGLVIILTGALMMMKKKK